MDPERKIKDHMIEEFAQDKNKTSWGVLWHLFDHMTWANS